MGFIDEIKIDPVQETDKIASFISSFVEERGANGVALGLSGGLDSSVVAALCAKALSPDQVSALILPERDSSPESVEDARFHAEKLGIRYRILDLTPSLRELGCYIGDVSELVKLGGGARAAVRFFPGLARKGYLTNLAGSGGKKVQEFLAFHRIKHRLRMVSIYREAEEHNLAVASCANRTEFEIGFFVRYGDDAGDFAPVKHLYKSQVFILGAFLEVPEKILQKKPSPDLFAGMKDEEIMGISYGELDSILWCLSHGLNDEEIEQTVQTKKKSISYVREIISQSGRLREAPASLL